MDNVKDDAYYISKIKDCLSFICKHMKEVSKDQFYDNVLLQDAMSFRLIQLSEDSKKLSDTFKNINLEISWVDIIGLRNRIVHDYGNVNLTIIYDTLKYDIPKVLKILEKYTT